MTTAGSDAAIAKIAILIPPIAVGYLTQASDAQVFRPRQITCVLMVGYAPISAVADRFATD
ncbi:hypothetical protein BQ8794_50610 [Mesorhizobium prunaredense]|uniref:Uncharacterized protein n=1 Tax=Mesorhizobium prunaredense TaxID=1631249 RepID=A0A1R3VF80_9HYPH|nr:hypothetical protein BQ8794_50610 [Mesorhizobium prunaredense]